MTGRVPAAGHVPGKLRRTLAAALFALAALALVATVPLTILSRQDFDGLVPVVIGVPGAITGVLAARRQPANPVGWLLLAVAACLLLANAGADYAVIVYRQGHQLPGGEAALILAELWGPGITLLGLLVLLFPDGKLTSAPWRWILRIFLLLFAASLCATAIQTAGALAAHPVRVDSGGDLAATDFPAGWYRLENNASTLVLLVFVLIVVLRQVLSWRTSSGERRQQLKLLASGSVAVLVSLILSFATPWPVLQAVGWLGPAALPVCVGIAIMKYRLYDIDRIVSRTLSYAIVTGLLVGLYVGLVALTTRVLGFTSPVGVAASTLAAVALFTPLRRRIQRLVDRRFNRARYNAETTLAGFTARLQDAVDVAAVQRDLAETVASSVEPAHLSLWLASRTR
jgi:hypothetical protein